MSAKVRSDAKLKTLPEERQAQLFDLFRDKGLKEIREELRQDGIVTSYAALSEFRSWYQLKQQFQEDEQTTETLIDQLKQEVPNLTDEQIDALGSRTFSLLAIRNQDPDTFTKLRSAKFKAELEKQKLALREKAEHRQERALALERQRFQRETCELFLKWCSDQRAKEIAASPAPNSEKIDQLGKVIFGELWK